MRRTASNSLSIDVNNLYSDYLPDLKECLNETIKQFNSKTRKMTNVELLCMVENIDEIDWSKVKNKGE